MSNIETAPDAEHRGTVASRIRASMDQLSAKERQVARVILSQYPAAGLETTAALSTLANVSGPTVVRFVARLGYAGYREFQTELRQELTAKTASPSTKAAPVAELDSMSRFTTSVAQTFTDQLQGTFDDLPGSELESALELLADDEIRLHIVGGRFTRILADYLSIHLRDLRPGVQFYRDAQEAASAVPDLRRRDCLVVFDFRRYQADVIALARVARATRVRIILVTDPWMSPIAELADVVLSARVDSASPFDSHISSLALVETMIAGVHGRIPEAAAQRISRLDDIARTLDTHL